MGGGTCRCLSPVNYQLSVSTDPTVWEAGSAGLGPSSCAQLVPAQGWGRLGHTRSPGSFPHSCQLLLPGTAFVFSSQWSAFLQTAGHQRGFVSKCWLSKNYGKQTLDMEGSSEILESTPLTLPLGKPALENKGALEGAGTVTPRPVPWAVFPLYLGLQHLVERGVPIPALQVDCRLWCKLTAWTGQEKFKIHCGTLFMEAIRKAKVGGLAFPKPNQRQGFQGPKSHPERQLEQQKDLHVAHAAAKSLRSCPTLCDPTDGSPPGSPIPGILQARTLEWVAIASSSMSPILCSKTPRSESPGKKTSEEQVDYEDTVKLSPARSHQEERTTTLQHPRRMADQSAHEQGTGHGHGPSQH